MSAIRTTRWSDHSQVFHTVKRDVTSQDIIATLTSLLWLWLYILAAWNMTQFVCPRELCCCYASEGRREEEKTEQAKQKQYKHLTVCLLFFFQWKVNLPRTLAKKNWALFLEEIENSQTVGEGQCTVRLLGDCDVMVVIFCLLEKELNSLKF